MCFCIVLSSAMRQSLLWCVYLLLLFVIVIHFLIASSVVAASLFIKIAPDIRRMDKVINQIHFGCAFYAFGSRFDGI